MHQKQYLYGCISRVSVSFLLLYKSAKFKALLPQSLFVSLADGVLQLWQPFGYSSHCSALAKLPLVQRHTAYLKISSIAFGSMCLLILYTVSISGQEEGYTVKYTNSPEGKGVYLTGYPELSLHPSKSWERGWYIAIEFWQFFMHCSYILCKENC